MIDYNKIISDCVIEGAFSFEVQINGGLKAADSFCFLYFERQAKKHQHSEFITNGEFYSMCLITTKGFKPKLIESNRIDSLLVEEILPIVEKALNTLILQIKATDSSDNTELKNPDKQKQKGKNMNLELLDVLVNLKMTSGAKPTPLDLLKKDLRACIHTYNGKQITALADVIFKSNTLNKLTKPADFSVWLKQFCDIVDVKMPTSKQNAVTKEYDTLKKAYYYLIP